MIKLKFSLILHHFGYKSADKLTQIILVQLNKLLINKKAKKNTQPPLKVVDTMGMGVTTYFFGMV